MINDTTILNKPKISIVINDMDWCDKVLFVFLSYFYVLMLANIISIEIYTWAFVKEVLVTSKLFIVTVFDFQL